MKPGATDGDRMSPSADIETPEDVFTWAESFTNFERSFPTDKRVYRLDRMRRLLGMFDDPDGDLAIIHVAGTKGKGSTSAFLASVLHAAGHHTGLYTSPHVQSAFERIVIAGEPPRAELLVRLGREVKRAIDALPAEGIPGNYSPTTFELYTLLAFLYFREAGCDEAVIETGIGGRLDATNVVLPRASVITPLDLEHTDILGDTLEKIALEKAGIIKTGAPAFVGFQPPAAKEVFRQVCAERGSACVFLDEEVKELAVRPDRHGTSFSMRLSAEDTTSFRLSMLGDFQAENASLAYLTLRRTRPEIPLSCYSEGFLATSLPGRMEVLGSAPVIVLDGAHTPLAVTRLLSAFRAIFPGDAVLIFGSVTGKKPREMAEIMAPAFSRIVISTPGSFKESSPEAVAKIFRALNPATVLEKDPARALERARKDSAGSLPILVTGSFYMVAEIRRLLT
jgi:dihydrofolate synthase / folylpolyglutamate synthase